MVTEHDNVLHYQIENFLLILYCANFKYQQAMIPRKENCRIIFFLLNWHFSRTTFYSSPFPLKFNSPPTSESPRLPHCVTSNYGGAGGTVSGCALSLCWSASCYPHHHWPMDTLIVQAFPQQVNPSQAYSTLQTLALNVWKFHVSEVFMPFSKWLKWFASFRRPLRNTIKKKKEKGNICISFGRL